MALAVRKKDRATTEKSCISNYDRAGLNVLNELYASPCWMQLLIVLPGILLSPSSGGLTRGSFRRPPRPPTPECMKQQKPKG